MNVAEKSTIVRREIRSLSEHHDENSAVRVAFLNDLKTFIDAEIEGIEERDGERLEALRNPA